MNKKISSIGMTRLVLIACTVILTVSVAFNIIGSSGKAPQGAKGMKGPAGSDSAEIETVFSVNTEKPSIERIRESLKVNGDVVAENSVEIYPDTSGKLIKRFVSIGDYVLKGDIIAKVDPSKPGTVYEASPVESTISGTVTRLPGSIGYTVTTATSVATIGDLENLQIQVFVPEKYLSWIKSGLKGAAEFVPYPGKEFSVNIAEVSPVLDTDSRTIEVKLSFDDFDSRIIRAGMFASVRIFTRVSESALTVPSSSVLESSSGSYVYAVEEGKAVVRFVETGLESDTKTEILSGLGGNENIIVSGQSLVEDGTSVKVIGGSL